MVGARWPNADWATKTMFTSDTWVGSTSESTYNGYTNPTHATYTGNENLGEPSLLVSTPCTEPARPACAGHVLEAARNPAGQLINATGASAILNIGHWVTYTAAVHEHMPGQANFTYMAADGWQVTKFVGEHSGYYLENSLELLDVANEWFYDTETRELHLKTVGDADPVRPRARSLSAEANVWQLKC